MAPLIYLADLCRCIDTVYHVSLEYGAHSGDVPHWQMRVAIPFKGIHLMRQLVRGDDVGANIAAAQSLGEEIKRLSPQVFKEPREDTVSLDTYKAP